MPSREVPLCLLWRSGVVQYHRLAGWRLTVRAWCWRDSLRRRGPKHAILFRQDTSCLNTECTEFRKLWLEYELKSEYPNQCVSFFTYWSIILLPTATEHITFASSVISLCLSGSLVLTILRKFFRCYRRNNLRNCVSLTWGSYWHKNSQCKQ